MSPPSGSLQFIREQGYRCEVVEKTIPRTFIEKDLFDSDIVELTPGSPILVAQRTTASNHAAHRTKLEAVGFIALGKGSGASLEI